MDQCPGLIGGVNDPSDSCNIPDAVDEVINGVLAQLPGDNPLGQWGIAPNVTTPASSPVSSGGSGTTPDSVANSAVGTSSTPEATPPTISVVDESGSNTVYTSYVTNYITIWTTCAVTSPSPTSVSSSLSPTLSPTSMSSSLSPTLSPTSMSSSLSPTLSPTSMSSSLSPTLSPTSVSSTSVSSSLGTAIVSGWAYTGCYSDSLSTRVLTGIEFADIGIHEVTSTNCIDYCNTAGYSVAGTEYGGQCFCDNSISSSELAATDCDMPCEGDSTETCGGSLALSVYTKLTTGDTARRAHNRNLVRHIQYSN
jgi:hypothetical protein